MGDAISSCEASAEQEQETQIQPATKAAANPPESRGISDPNHNQAIPEDAAPCMHIYLVSWVVNLAPQSPQASSKFSPPSSPANLVCG